MSARKFLSHVRIDSFGAFAGKAVGPFSSGLNVVYGPNEAGKTTLASFIFGVLFGWEDARGNKNTYRPANAERSGALFFSDREDGSEAELARARNAEGLLGDTTIVEDVDKETFRRMFFLTSDELRSLRNTTDVTAKLLTAGSGTNSSPAHALLAIQDQMAGYTSRAAGAERSIVKLAEEADALRADMAAAERKAELHRRQEREFAEIAPKRGEMNEKIVALNAEIERMYTARATIEKLDGQIAAAQEEKRQIEEGEIASEGAIAECGQGLAMSAADERTIRDRLETLADEQAKCRHRVEIAQENYTSSKAAYEALLEASRAEDAADTKKHRHSVQMVVSVLLPLVFIASGILLFMHGREISSLSYTVLGMALVVFSLFLACAAFVLIFRPDKTQEERESKKQDLQWVMLQDKKRYEACCEDLDEFTQRARTYLNGIGLEEADGSLRRARALLDEANERRAARNLALQKSQAVHARKARVDAQLEDAMHQRIEAAAKAGFAAAASLEDIDQAIAKGRTQRSELLDATEIINRRHGELSAELAQAREEHDFDRIKMAYQQVKTRLQESVEEYAELLVAKRMIEVAIAAWESKSQPEVYQRASELLSHMTAGRWTQISLSDEGTLMVSDAVRTKRDPRCLSLSTCQQLYLSLRIALLITADNVGRSIPIIADDILVNFDAARRVQAARALADLAKYRQVIVLTCHEEVVEVLRQADEAIRVIEL